MISLSHWGMFVVQPAVMMIPAGFKLSQKDIEEWQQQPSQIVQFTSGVALGLIYGYQPLRTGKCLR